MGSGGRSPERIRGEKQTSHIPLVRLALWSAVRNGETFRLRARAMARADVLFSTLILATLRGVRLEVTNAEGRWSAALADLSAEG